MLQKLLEHKYGIQVEEYVKLDSYEALRGNGWLYLVAKPDGRESEDIIELEKIAEHLRKMEIPMYQLFYNLTKVNSLRTGKISNIVCLQIGTPIK